MDQRTKRWLAIGGAVALAVIAVVALVVSSGGSDDDDAPGTTTTTAVDGVDGVDDPVEGDEPAGETEDPEGDDPGQGDGSPGEDDAPIAQLPLTPEVDPSPEEVDYLVGLCEDGDPNACYDVALRGLDRPGSLPAGAEYARASDGAVSDACFLEGIPAACFEAGTRSLPPAEAIDGIPED